MRREQNKEKRAESREKRAQSKEHRAESTEQRAQSTGHRAEAPSQLCPSCTLWGPDEDAPTRLLTAPAAFPSHSHQPCHPPAGHCRAGEPQRTKTVSKAAPEMVQLRETPQNPGPAWCLGRSARADANSQGLEGTQRKSHIHTASWTVCSPERQEGCRA